jgi:hypothetical protein
MGSTERESLAYRLHIRAGTRVACHPREEPVLCHALLGRWRLPKTPRLAGCGATSPLLFYLPASANRRTIGTNVLKSSGLGTCRSNPAFIAASMSLFEA